ncbi:alpha/beta fold hydrolase [Sphingomonas olei]|uniref:Alpha/beta fold hydrolase n=1 Tax=Sphingomonas olei TaxID=1886787 RepID=A0ABY2QE40_9SPHN|nr:alpha/beta fold hydrolase [Sphingomonas olei]THG37844.1 alpha/beta fold hydrolase [Sphingomonas olei]
MSIVAFAGFGGVRLEADVQGDPAAPAVLLVHGAGQTRAVWQAVARALVDAGRRVVSLDLRGHGGSERPADGRYAFDAFVGDLRAVLAQLDSRPVVVAASLGAWAATAALAGDAATLASGLVLADLPPEIDQAASRSVAERLRGQAGDWDLRVLESIELPTIPARLAQAAAAIRVPVLYVRGGSSMLETPAQASAFAARMADCEYAEVDGARLLVTADSTDAFNALLLDFLERRLPCAAPEFRQGSDARTLRDALGCFATGVTIVTAMTLDGTPIGLTANSFTSVSLDPPLLLVCIANSAGSAPALAVAERFAVNVLQIGQQPASNRFAGKGEDRFAATDWAPGENGAPVLAGSLSAFECTRHAVHGGGDHFILVGRVTRATFEPQRDPLLYFRGKYRRLHFA